ncbi:electron transport complex subunit RsxC [Vibrio nitrifigilis]|uniref:Ion-translocating oxidoreductase complex subunit C n=1 Tax=Vibrio nitrifigilis TaxID=2789781 RepID=A0ABS0GKJ8_9VIBR|nr:electron transport complex subunit RsxC [Vibrio nitrifigilis]MBF9002981.1 electron transport complex subunit RsxC [Vibrio nitrifigilis]
MLRLFSHGFSGGVHPKTFKHLTSDKPIDENFWPRYVYLPLQQRDGAVVKPLVNVGDMVFRGQLIAQSLSERVAPIHSPVNGIVTKIAPYITPHPAKIYADTIEIRANEDRHWGTPAELGAFHQLDPDTILERIQKAGIVGLGGAGFPTAMKLSSARKAGVETLIINGGECEPYLTSDDVTMQTYAAEVISGIKLMQIASGAKRVIVGIEDNKQTAIYEMTDAASEEPNIEIRSVPSIYPMGSAKQLIKTLVGKEVPQGGRSSHIGVVVNNIATARSVYHAVRFRRPLVNRIVTISGQGVSEPRNVEAPIGTRVQDLINYCGGTSESTERLVLGGPMMGQIITSLNVPIDKMVGGILALTSDEIMSKYKHQQCIRCGQCVRACPMSLMPFQMAAYTKVSDFKKAEELGVRSCLSCGACSYVCPSSIPLVQYFMHAKGVINSNWQKERKSQQAKQLTEAKRHRMEEEAKAKLAAKQAKQRPVRGARVAESGANEAPARPTRPGRPGRPARPTTQVVSEESSLTGNTQQDVANLSERPARPARPARKARSNSAVTETKDNVVQMESHENSAQVSSRPARPTRPARPPRRPTAQLNPDVQSQLVAEPTESQPDITVKAERPARPPRPARVARKTTVTEEDQQ